MTDALVSWLLSIPYLLTGFGFLFISWAAGGYGYALLCSYRASSRQLWYLETTGAGLFLLVVRIAAGLALISWISAIVGVAGRFRAETLFSLLIPVIVLGLPVAHRYALRHKPMLLRDRLDLGSSWLASPRLEKAFASLIILVFCVIVVNALIGALVPDMNQDPMWYHLSVPQQWVFAQRFEVYPNVMPSAYPLAVEALYAAIFLLKPDPVLCSLLTAMSGSILFIAMVATASMAVSVARPGASRGWAMGAVVGLWIPMLMVHGMVAPVQPKNDMMVMLWTFAGAMTLWLPLLSARCAPSAGWWIVGGFILGTACSAKPSILGITFFTMVFCVPLSLYYEKKAVNGWPGKAISGALLCLAAMAVAAAPWMYRGYMSHGMPLYPLGRSLFSFSPDYVPVLTAFDSVNGFVEFSWVGWSTMVSNFPARLAGAAGTGEKGIFLYILLICAGLFFQKSLRWRWFSCMLLFQMLLLVGMRGAAEVFRFFSPAYYVAVPLLAWIIADAAPRLGRRVRLFLGCLVCVAMLASVGLHQYRLASFKTMDWEFRPVLSDDDIRSYATHAEMGPLSLRFAQLQNAIDKDERVLLLGSPYPFYLHRDTLWNDEAIGAGGVADQWGEMDAETAERFLTDEKIDAVLYAARGSESELARSPVPGLLEAGVLKDIPLPEDLSDAGWALFRYR